MKWRTKWDKYLAAMLGYCLLWFLSACSKPEQGKLSFGPPEVLVTEVLQQDVPVIKEWIGSLDGSVDADVRARVSGYLVSQNYQEGRLVKTGDLLFQVDPTIYEAALEQAKAGLAQAKANQLQTDQAEKRTLELFAQRVESAQDRDNAVQQNDAAKAAVKAQEAAVHQAEINLEFTKLTAPVTGIAGIANVNIGDLVSPTDGQPVTTVSTVDPIKAYFQISEQDYLKAQQSLERDPTGKILAPPIELILADDTLYAEKGNSRLSIGRWTLRQERFGWLHCSRIPKMFYARGNSFASG
jgi:membrane fusion protein (multidrug efflux system)